MSEIVVITTDDLESAVRLRGAFEAADFDVDLLTAGERLEDANGTPQVLILTGGLRERRARALVAEARASRLPVIGLLEPSEPASRDLARHLGLSEVFPKPVDVEEVVLVGRRLIQRERLRAITAIVGETEVMDEVLERVVQIATVDSTVLILGESGTGKELVARGIHALSSRRHRPFIAVNVAALPENLLESELFGHEKGAFTGASSLRKGLFELANGGTIFLDEIGEMPLTTQTKLLRVLEQREFRRVGGEDEIRVDVRVIAATNRNLRDQVELREFRRDLYHRLNVLRIELPPLRERREDIPRLIDAFTREFSREHDRPFLGIDPAALQILVEYRWPGNVRELRNLIESMVVLAPGQTIRPEDIPSEVRWRGSSLLPVPVTLPAASQSRSELPGSQELEFVLRTLFDLKIDIEDLRREFDAYRSRQREPSSIPLYSPIPSIGGAGSTIQFEPLPPEEHGIAEEIVNDDAVVFRPGVTMQEMERQAIVLALRKTRRNRRRAAEMLGIGERTLYRKIKEYGLED